MKSLNKPTIFILSFCMLCSSFSLSGCGKTDGSASETSASSQTTDSSVESETSQEESEASQEAEPSEAADHSEAADEPAALETADLEVIHEPEFGGVYIKMTIDEFNALGFEYGDSVDIVFSNGYELRDRPYYNGYYTLNGESLLVAYPGYEYIKACINNGDDLWVTAGIDESMTAKIILNESAKYLNIQNARNIQYKDERDRFPSDEVFANFRSIKVSGLKENTVYRSASPCDNQHNRAPFVDKLIADAGVAFILDLADNEEKIEKYMSADDFSSEYYAELYKAGNVLPIALNMNYGSEDFKEKIANGFTAMSEHDGPYLVHCTEGKDRTGFVCMLLEALAGASYEEIEQDYMLTYDNYYKINKDTDKEKYDVIVENVFLPMIRSMVGDESVDVASADLSGYAEKFLLDAGMNEEALNKLKDKIRAG